MLRELHRAWVQRLRRRTLGRALIAGSAIGVGLMLGAAPGGSFWLLAGLIGAASIQSAVEWRRALREDATSSSTLALAGFSEEQQRAQAFDARLADTRPVMTMTLVAIVALVTIVEWLTAGSVSATVARAGLVKPLVADGEWWRLVTSTFVHAGAVHVLMNMGALATFGRYFEAAAPRLLLCVTYVVAGMAGSLASWWLRPDASSLGASGAVIGVVAFLAVYGVRNPDLVPAKVRHRAWMAILLTGFVGAVAFSLIDNGGHAGGALAGAAIAILTRSRGWSPVEHRSPRGLVALGAVAAVAIVAGALRTVVALAADQPLFSKVRAADDGHIPVTLVTATIGHDRTGLHIIVNNHGGRRLEAYDLTVIAGTLSGHVWRDDCCLHSDGHTPVIPGGTARIAMRDTGRSMPGEPRVQVNAVMFDDGTFEGSRRLRDAIVQRRRNVVHDADYWIEKLAIVASAPASSVASRLQIYADARANYTDVSITVVTAFGIYELMVGAKQEASGVADSVRRTRDALIAVRESLIARLNAVR